MLEGEFKFPEQSSDEELDRLLLSASWPEPTAESGRRLARQWEELSKNPAGLELFASSGSDGIETDERRGRFKIWQPAFAVAASLGLVLLCPWMIHRLENIQVPTIAVRPVQASQVPVVETKTGDPGRPATNIELAMLRVMNSRRRADKTGVMTSPQGVALVPLVTGWSISPRTQIQSVAIVAAPDPAILASRAMAARKSENRDRLLDQLVALKAGTSTPVVLNLLSEPATASPIIAALVRHPRGWSDVLFAALNDSRVLVRSSASQALARIDGPVITARLIDMADADINRREAVAALVRIDSEDARQYVATAKQTAELGAIVRSALAQNGTFATQTGVLP